MDQRDAHLIFRLSLILGIAIALLWGVWGLFAPLPPYRRPFNYLPLSARVWWWDVLIVMATTVFTLGLSRTMVWGHRLLTPSEIAGTAGLIVGIPSMGVLGGIFLWVPGMVAGMIVGAVIGPCIFGIMEAAALSLGKFAWQNIKAAARVPVGLVTGGVPLAWKRAGEFINANDVK